MTDVQELLREAIGSYEPRGDERAVERRVQRRRRTQRVSSAVVALGLFGAVAWLGWAVLRPGESTLGSTPSPVPTAAPVVVPDVLGDTQEEARAALEALGLTVTITTEPADGQVGGVVVTQDPAAGLSVVPGAAVTIGVTEGPAAGEPIPIAGLPRAGVAVSSDGLVELVDLEGRVVAELPGFAIIGNLGAPGVWLERDGTYYVLSDVLDELVPVTEEEANDRAYDEGAEPSLPPPPEEPAGRWRYAIETVPAAVLAQWSGECEVPVAYWIEGGDTEIVTGGVDPSTAPSSVALGWSQDGEAIVQVSQGACGGTTDEPGIYRFSAPGGGRLVYPAPDGAVVTDAWGTGL
jgi:PASTA domain